ncbi:MAG: RNA polymerase sigma factor [Pseudomonadota bacterium]
MELDVRNRIDRNLKGLFGFAVALTSDEDRARDLVQDAVVKALQASNVPPDDRAFRVWLFKILKNVFIDQMRRDRVDFMDPDEIEIVAGDDGWTEDRQITVLAVRSAFAELSRPHRNVLALVDVAGMSYGEVAEVLNVPQGTVMSRVARARARLMDEMQQDNVTLFPNLSKRARN